MPGTHRFRGPSDLHLHSDHSDGTEAPAEVVAAAHRYGLNTLALTDHDTTSGWTEAAEAAALRAMTLLPGMELTAQFGWRSVHVLGYLFDPHDAALGTLLERIRSSRLSRAREMADRLARDFDLTWDDVLTHAGEDATVGRPHLADALVARGIVPDRHEAFERILYPGSDYYVRLFAPDPVTAVTAIVDAGGVAIIAHPSGRGSLLPPEEIERMLAAGLAGFELEHRDNEEPGTSWLRTLAAERDLIVTGSSDYHGRGKPNLPGEHRTSDVMVARIISQGRGCAPVYG